MVRMIFLHPDHPNILLFFSLMLSVFLCEEVLACGDKT
jgi:hypothetical protein